MSEGMTYLNEGFVMFYSGVAPTFLGQGGVKEPIQDIKDVSRVLSQMSTSVLSSLTSFESLTIARARAGKEQGPQRRDKHLGGCAAGLQMVDREPTHHCL